MKQQNREFSNYCMSLLRILSVNHFFLKLCSVSLSNAFPPPFFSIIVMSSYCTVLIILVPFCVLQFSCVLQCPEIQGKRFLWTFRTFFPTAVQPSCPESVDTTHQHEKRENNCNNNSPSVQNIQYSTCFYNDWHVKLITNLYMHKHATVWDNLFSDLDHCLVVKWFRRYLPLVTEVTSLLFREVLRR
jgi:hypothetical protein